jgi:ATP-dependent DNA ligase
LGETRMEEVPLFQRKAELKKILTGTDIQFSESFEIDDREMFAHVCKVGLGGVVSKVRAASIRRDVRTTGSRNLVRNGRL